jgi:DNA-binding XRE family transcriptional regulator
VILAPADAAAVLRSARRQHRLTQEELGTGLGVAPLAVTNWEGGKDTPALGNLVRWAEAVGFSLRVDGAPPGSVVVPRRDEPLEQFHVRRVAGALADARRAADRTQEMVGGAVGVSAWTIHMWETHRRIPRLPRLIAWCGSLRCELVLAKRSR